MSHPLDPLTAEEIGQAVSLARADPAVPDTAAVSAVALDEPDKADVYGWVPGQGVERRARVQLVPGPEPDVVEAVVSLTHGKVVSAERVQGVRPALLFGEALVAIEVTKADPAWREAMRRRGITDLDKVQIDPWPAGSFGLAFEEGRRLARCLSYIRDDREDNGYARPVEGLIAVVDMGRGEMVEVLDYGLVPVPAERGNYRGPDAGTLRADLRPLEITQPEGPSFVVDGQEVRWQRWSMRLSFDSHEGLVLHQVGYEDAGRVRPILYRASVSEMVVPYGHPGPMHGWKNAFDAGEWGLGRMTQPLELGCDCLGEIRYFDATIPDESGGSYEVRNAVCMHEEDYGIGWKHVDLQGGTADVRRSRRLVLSFVSTVGNYDYGFFWYFYLDGSIQFEVKLTGILSTMALSPGEEPSYANRVAPNLAAPHHQHMFNVRLDMDVDGPANTVYEVDVVPSPEGPEAPMGNAFDTRVTPLETELAAQRVVDPAASRTWRIANPGSVNALGEPVAYKLVPGPTPTMLAGSRSSVAKRAAFATRNLWVTPYERSERRAAGEYPNQGAGGDGLPRWTAADRRIANTDVVVWYSFGVTHIVRPEDWPVMPVEYAGFWLVPFGFFDRNPALDVPAGRHCGTAGGGTGE